MAETFPQITEAAYFRVREAFRQSLPHRVTKEWVMANIAGYTKEISARSLVGQIVRTGLINEKGVPTEAAALWRLDDSFDAGCEMLLRSAFPADIVDAFNRNSPTREAVINLFMSRKLGEQTARNASGLFLLLANRARAATKSSVKPSTSRRPAAKVADERRPINGENGSKPDAVDTPADPPASTMVLRYLLERSRLAELRLPADITNRQRWRLFRHLEIDLLDNEESEE